MHSTNTRREQARWIAFSQSPCVQSPLYWTYMYKHMCIRGLSWLSRTLTDHIYTSVGSTQTRAEHISGLGAGLSSQFRLSLNVWRGCRMSDRSGLWGSLCWAQSLLFLPTVILWFRKKEHLQFVSVCLFFSATPDKTSLNHYCFKSPSLPLLFLLFSIFSIFGFYCCHLTAEMHHAPLRFSCFINLAHLRKLT